MDTVQCVQSLAVGCAVVLQNMSRIAAEMHDTKAKVCIGLQGWSIAHSMAVKCIGRLQPSSLQRRLGHAAAASHTLLSSCHEPELTKQLHKTMLPCRMSGQKRAVWAARAAPTP
jgi:hypothetical protein